MGARRGTGAVLSAAGLAVTVAALLGSPPLVSELTALATGVALMGSGAGLATPARRWVPVTVGTLVTLALALGLIGYARDRPSSGLDDLYFTLILFAGSYTPVKGGVPPVLEVARLSAFAAVSSGVLAVLAEVGSSRIMAVKARFARDHWVVVGLGDEGLALCTSFRERGRRVVGVDLELDPVRTAPLAESGVLLVRADARDSRQHARFGLRRARALLAAAGADHVNADVARTAAASRTDLACLAYADDLALCELLRSTAGFGRSDSGRPRLDFFNVYENVAQDLARDLLAGTSSDVPVRAVVVGTSQLGLAFVLQVRRQALAAPFSVTPVEITVLDAQAGEVVPRWVSEWPELIATEGWSLFASDVLVDDPVALAERALFEGTGPQHVYVCSEPTARSLQAAVRTSRSVPTTAWAAGARTMTQLLGPGLPLLRLVDVVEEGRRPDLVEDDVRRQLGRAAHDWYLAREARSAGRPVRTTERWEDLDADRQADNVAQVEHLRERLEAHGYQLQRRSAGRAEVVLPAPLVEELAEAEHERWAAARRAKGWTHGPKDDEARCHPDLVAWERLDDTARSKDLDAVARFPQVVASVGYQLVTGSGWL